MNKKELKEQLRKDMKTVKSTMQSILSSDDIDLVSLRAAMQEHKTLEALHMLICSDN